MFVNSIIWQWDQLYYIANGNSLIFVLLIYNSLFSLVNFKNVEQWTNNGLNKINKIDKFKLYFVK